MIFTGKNGSGKTSLLLGVNSFLQMISRGNYSAYENQETKLLKYEEELKTATDPQRGEHLRSKIKDVRRSLEDFGGAKLFFSNKLIAEAGLNGDFLMAFFDAKRHSAFTVPSGITKVNLSSKYDTQQRASTEFIQYIVNLKADRSFARDDDDSEAVDEIDEWFARFQAKLREIFEAPDLTLVFNRQTYNFEIRNGNLPATSFNTLPHGYSAIMSIVTELLMRMEGRSNKFYDMQGLVLIDEIETHLHVDLQKKILPFLTSFFPKIQFIVTTHSPFVISSVSNAVICDLETGVRVDDLSGYSYDALIESYFNSDKYSDEVKRKIQRFEELSSVPELSESSRMELRHLRNYFAHVPKYLSKELLVKLQQIELDALNDTQRKD